MTKDDKEDKEERTNLVERIYQNSGADVGGWQDKVEAGVSVREQAQPVCKTCRRLLDRNNFGFCSSCNEKLCDEHNYTWDGVSHCRTCVLESSDLGKLEYKLLKTLRAGVRDVREIARLVRATRREVMDSLARLVSEDYLTKEGVSVFSKYVMPAKTAEAINSLDAVFEDERDVLEMTGELEGGEQE